MGTGCKSKEQNGSQELESFARQLKLDPFSTKASMPSLSESEAEGEQTQGMHDFTHKYD